MLVRLMKGTGANALGQIGIICVQLASVPVLTTHWSLQTYGVWLMLMTIPAYLVFGDFGFSTAAGNEMTMLVARKEIGRALAVYQSAALVTFVMASGLFVVSAILCMALPSRLFTYDGGPDAAAARWSIFALSVYGILGFLGSLIFAGYRSCGLYARGTAYVSLIQIIDGCLQIGTVYAGGSILTLSLVAVSFRSSITILQFLVLSYQVPWLTLGFRRVETSLIRRLLKPSIAVVALSGGQLFLLLGTVLTLGAATSAGIVAVFTTTRTMIRAGIQLTGLINRALMPEYSAAVGLGDTRGERRMIWLTCGTSLALLIPAAIVLLAFGKTIIAFWTHGTIVPSSILLALMVVVMIAEGTWVPLSNLILAANKHDSYAYHYFYLSLLAIFISYPASLAFGAAGAAGTVMLVSLMMCLHVFTLTARSLKAPV